MGDRRQVAGRGDPRHLALAASSASVRDVAAVSASARVAGFERAQADHVEHRPRRQGATPASTQPRGDGASALAPEVSTRRAPSGITGGSRGRILAQKKA